MAAVTAVTMQRDLVVNLKRETFHNLAVLNKLRPMSPELSRLVFKENAVEKPTQNMFNQLAYYLVAIIDEHVAAKFLWPIHDSKAEREFRSQLSSFITDYSSKGLLFPVMSSYLVNPGCYKVTMLMFQMSQLAVQRLLVSVTTEESKKYLYIKMTEKYNTGTEDFVEDINREVETIVSKFNNHQRKRFGMEKIAALFRERITSMESKLAEVNAQKFIDNLVDNYVKANVLDEDTKTEILNIKDLNHPASYFDSWLNHVDVNVKQMESKWDEKMTPFINICMECQRNTNALIARHTGEADSNSYMIEYNHLTDEIRTNELQNEVNSQQKYILKNIVRNERLHFPNLIRSFLISINYILRNNEIGDEIFKFNKYLESGKESLNELVSAMRILNNRVMNAEAKLMPPQFIFDHSISVKDFGIPTLPNLSGLKSTRDTVGQVLFNTLTPLSMSKHQFNLRRKYNTFSFTKPQPKILITPFHQTTRNDVLKNFISCRVSTYDGCNVSSNFHNISMISQATSRGNETIAEYSTGFTKQQIMRLLSTKKSSSSKKFKDKTERPNINVKKGGLFNESNVSNDSNGSNGLFRSHSSPNLYENREKRNVTLGKRKLSIMHENSPSLLEVSGIATLEKDDTYSTPEGVGLEGPRKLIASVPIPVITITPAKVFKAMEADLNKEIVVECSEIQATVIKPRKSYDNKEEFKTETPKTNPNLVRKTNSLEKIISRFKKVRAGLMPSDKDEEEFKTIVEEKENCYDGNVDVFKANRILLPDLLSPSCSVPIIKSIDYLDQLCLDLDDKVEGSKTRQSLGTVLGVDNTFLDQFDLSD